MGSFSQVSPQKNTGGLGGWGWGFGGFIYVLERMFFFWNEIFG